MSQIHVSRKSAHPFVDTIWRSRNLSDGVYSATPDGSWDFIVLIDQKGNKQMMVTGQATKPAKIPYQAGTSSVVISFAPGVYIPSYPAKQLLDSFEILPSHNNQHFLLVGYEFVFPTFENAEQLIEEMVELNILKSNSVVDGAVQGAPKATSDRSKQRHFASTTGLSEKYLEQIKRAQHAAKLLQQGKKPIDAAIEAGYSDQSHLAKSLKKIMDTKPSDVDGIHKL